MSQAIKRSSVTSSVATLPSPSGQNNSGLMLYRIKPGDSFSRILHTYYGVHYGSPRYQTLQGLVQQYNPWLTNPNQIVAGKLLQLPDYDPVGVCLAPSQALITPAGSRQSPAQSGPLLVADELPWPNTLAGRQANRELYRLIEQSWPTDAAEGDAFWAMAQLEANWSWLSAAGGTGLGFIGNTLSTGNVALIEDVGLLYSQYQQGRLTKGQYDARRAKALKTFARRIGPMEQLLLGGKNAREAVRIARHRTLPPTHHIARHAGRLKSLSRLAARSGVVLTGVGVYMGCRQIAQTNDRYQKNEIFVETLSSSGAGLLGGVVVSVVLASNPVGWGVALVLAAGTTVASWGAGKAGVQLYNKYLDKYDVVSTVGVDQWCHQ